MRQSNRSENILARFAGVCLVLGLLAGVTACSLIEPRQIAPPSSSGSAGAGEPYRPAEPRGAAGVLGQARQARAAGDLSRAERLYLSATSMKDLPAADLAPAWRELAEVAKANGHPNVALNALSAWQQADPQADYSPAWQSLWFSVISGLTPGEARTQAQRVYDDDKNGWPARALAGVALSGRLLSAGLQDNALQVLGDIASNPGTRPQKPQLEHRLLTELQRLNPTQQANLATLVTTENETRFPYSVFLYLVASKQAAQSDSPEDKAAAEAVMARLRQYGVLSGPAPESPPSLFAGGSGLSSPGTSFGQAQGHGVALLLPLSGSLGNLGMKIVQGARIAQAEGMAAGRPFSLTVIDSDVVGWQEEVARLPVEVRVVGGPLLPKLYGEIKGRGLTSGKVFFTFLQTIDQGDEGRVAWRFFASPNDQMDALLGFASGLGVTSFASYAPSDSYGSRMSGIFGKALAQRGLHLSHSGSYPANAPQEWNKAVASFLNTGKNASNAPNSPYKAVFLPDSWKSMEIIIPTMFYYRETRQLLLGTSLWEQGLQSSGKVDARYHDLAVFPGAWLGNNQAASRLSAALSASGQTPDLWYAIGYDFARLGAGLAVTDNWSAARVNAELAKAGGFDWSMAPIRWDAEGIAHQELILFTPVENGFAPADLEAMRQRFANAWGH